ncbi:hypothetical protein RJ640_025419 [Escallonia rubra]|uniref:GPI transamidase component PIG-T n=1 Tax=Escallonia rubra TaxID=112253 RepID=A0AA88S150_9ASTE|nr:hypothetical protein RJ640_025419 [Escallonia rubra]
MVRLKLVLVLFILCFASTSTGKEKEGIEEQFTEELLLRPLPDRKVLAHFHFDTRAPPTASYGRHHRIFPKAIYQLRSFLGVNQNAQSAMCKNMFQASSPEQSLTASYAGNSLAIKVLNTNLALLDQVHKFQVREMELSFTQGRWNYERWGGYDPIASSNVKPPGVELWAVFDVPQDQVDASWKNLTHTLSGLFCASVNYLESSTAYSAPDWSFREFSGNLRYGTLPREAICTENLTPWLKLLPCRDKAGLSGLMNRSSIYRGFYHSQRLHLTSGEFNSEAVNYGIMLEQTLTVVLEPNTLESGVTRSSGLALQPSWSLSSLFGRELGERCVLAKSSNVYVQLEGSLVSVLKNKWEETSAYEADTLSYEEGSLSNPSFELSVSPNRIIKEVNSLHPEGSSILYHYMMENYSDSKPFELEFKWKSPLVWSCPQAPLHASRFLMGSGNERGAIAISLQATKRSDDFLVADIDEKGCRLRVDVFQVVPWYVKVYYHTLKLFVDEKPQSQADIIEKMRVSPSEDKVSPGVMELILRLPCGVKSAAITLEFDKGFLHIDEYPPDANQGFDIPSAVVSFPDFQATMHFLEDNSSNELPLVSKMKERSSVLSYTEVLLVPLTTPDFSMPYNVITITCTVFALYFGSLLNALRKRVAEEESRLKSKAAKKSGRVPLLLSKLLAKVRGKPWEPPQAASTSSSQISYKLIFKVILVAGIAAVRRGKAAEAAQEKTCYNTSTLAFSSYI